MMTQNVKSNVIDSFTTVKSNKSTASSGKSKKTSSFDDVMDSNLKAKNSQDSRNTKVTTKDVNDNDATETDKAVVTDKNTGNQDIKTSSDTTVQVTMDESELKEDLKELSDKIEDILSDLTTSNNVNILNLSQIALALQETIKSKLGITDEEFNKAMESLGFTVMDLFNTDNLKQFLLQVKGSDDMSDFLTNEDLGNTLKDLMQAVDVLKQKFSVTDAEISAYNQQLKADVTETSIPTQDEAKNVSEVDTNTSDINVTVVKSGDMDTSEDTLANTSDKQDNSNASNETQNLSSIDLFVQNLVANSDDNSLGFSEQIATARQMQDITNQIVEQIKIFIKPDQTSMELQLNPESLGKINLSVVAKDGIMTAHFTAQNEIAKAAIESQMQTLRDNLNNQGLKVDAIEVTVSNFDFNQSSQTSSNTANQQNQSKSRQRLFKEDDSILNADETETNVPVTLEQGTNSIDYSA